MEWTIITVITGLVGLFVTVGKPISNLVKTITEQNVRLDNLAKQHYDDEKRNGKSHDRIWRDIENHEHKLEDHEIRLTKLEK